MESYAPKPEGLADNVTWIANTAASNKEDVRERILIFGDVFRPEYSEGV